MHIQIPFLSLALTLLPLCVDANCPMLFSSSSLFLRFTLDMTKHLVDNHIFDAAMAKDVQSIESSVDSSQTVFFSLNKGIYRSSTSQENNTSVQIIRNDVEIKSFRQISTRRFLVSDKDSVKVYQLSNSLNDSTIDETLVCRKSGCCQEPNSRCRRNKSFVLGPTAVDRRSSPEAAYYVDDTTLYWVNLSTNDSATSYKFNSMGERVTAMAFNDDYSIAFIFCSNTMNVYKYDFQSKTTTPIPFEGNQTRLFIEQTVPIDEDLFLCCTQEQFLLLLNIKTGSHSYVHGGTTHFSSITSNRSQELLKVNQIADIPTKGSYLLAVGTNHELIHFQYAVTNSSNDSSRVTTVTGSNEVTNLGREEKTASVDPLAVIGYTAAVGVLAVGVSIAFVSLRYKKKKRQLIRKYAHRHRRQRRPPDSDSDRVIEDIQLRTLRQQDVQQGEDQLKAESVNKSSSTTSSEENQVRDRPIRPILPNKHRQPPVHVGTNDSSVEPYYVKVLNTQMLVQTPPYVRPRLSLLPDERNKDHEQNSSIHPSICRRKDEEQQRKDYLNEESVGETKNTSWSKENLLGDRTSPLPDQHRKPPVHVDSKDSSAEPYYVEVLDHVDRSTTACTTATKPPYIRPRLSLPPRERSSEILDLKQHSSKFSPPNSPGIRKAGPCSEDSPYSDIVRVSPEHSADYNHYAYAHKPLKASDTKGIQEDNEQNNSNPQPEIVFTITSEKTEIKVWPKQKKEVLN